MNTVQRFHQLTRQVIRLSFVLSLLATLGLAQDSNPPQQSNPPIPISLRADTVVKTKLTIKNDCDSEESYKVETQGLPDTLLHPTTPIPVGAKGSKPMELEFDTKGIQPGTYSGNMVVLCTTCKESDCKPDRRLIPAEISVIPSTSSGVPLAGPSAPSTPANGTPPTSEGSRNGPTVPGSAGGPGTKGTASNGSAVTKEKFPPVSGPGGISGGANNNPTITRKVRRCLTFWIRNSSGKPVSDLHFPGAKGVEGHFGTPENWRTGNTEDGGITFQANEKDAKAEKVPPIPPGKDIGPLTICTDDDKFSLVSDQQTPLFSHPGETFGTRVKLDDFEVPRSNGKGLQSAVGPDGTARIPPSKKAFVYEVHFNSGKQGGWFQIKTAGGKVLDGNNTVNGVQTSVGNEGNISVDKQEGAGRVPPNTDVTALFESPSSSITAQVIQKGDETHDPSVPVTAKKQ